MPKNSRILSDMTWHGFGDFDRNYSNQGKSNLSPSKKIEHLRCVKSVRIRSFSGPYFPAFELNSPYLSVLIPNTQKYGPEKLQIRTPLT